MSHPRHPFQIAKDRWGLSWQIIPRALADALAAGGGEAKRAFAPMRKIDVATIEAGASRLRHNGLRNKYGDRHLVSLFQSGNRIHVVTHRKEA